MGAITMKVSEKSFQALREAAVVASRLGQEVANREVLEKALLKVAQPLAQRMRANAPSSGKTPYLDSLAGSIEAIPDKAARKAGTAAVLVGPMKRKGGHGWLAHLHEFEWGGMKYPARPFIRPAWDEVRDTLDDDIASEIKEQFFRVVRKYAKRAGRAA